MFGVQSSKESTKEAQGADDDHEMDKIFNALNINPSCIKFTRRFTTKTVGSRPPPILVQLMDERDKFRVLKEAKELRKMEEFKNVFINPDMTEAERILDKQMKEARYTINQRENSSASGTRWGIRNSRFRRIITDEPPFSEGQRMQY